MISLIYKKNYKKNIMTTLNQDLEMLRQLNKARDTAKKLREQALFPLKFIEEISENETEPIIWDNKPPINREIIDFEENDRWVASRDKVEIALLVKVQSHRNISENEDENNRAEPVKKSLKDRLTSTSLEELIQPIKKENHKDRAVTIPVLVAARTMQTLVKRAETVFEPATMFCYYRIIRELYGVAQPNWTVGAARAGIGGTTSAFITNECLRAIFNFKNTLERTHQFFENTSDLFENFFYIKKMLRAWNIDSNKQHPLYIWADKTIEAMWLDCYLSTNPRSQEMALFLADDENKNSLLLPDGEDMANLESIDKYFDQLPGKIEKALENVFQNLASVYKVITEYRKNNERKEKKKDIIQGSAPNFIFNDPRPRDEEKINNINRTATAHLFAEETILNAVFNANDLLKIIRKFKGEKTRDGETIIVYATGKLLKELSKEFYKITQHISEVLEPSNQYLEFVINRELAASDATFDAGELVFAATSYGAIKNWQIDERLRRACEKLINSLPDNGRLPTKHPFHADSHGYRMIPIACEMTRALANLLQRTGYDFDANFVDRMVNIFGEKSIELPQSTAKNKLIAWNFKDAPEEEKPAVWVTAIGVLALDRIVRMLNTRINEIILKHFDVIKPDENRHKIYLHELIYSDYGLVEWDPKENEHPEGKSELTAIGLQKMRAHIMRATLPKKYQGDRKNFSAIFYGPPGTGKTTLAESLALSGRVPFVKLSPSDLILQGQELLEGRARDVFEALSMLTQCVIIFDEFEPVLKNRKKKKTLISDIEKTHPDYYPAHTFEALQEISQRDDPKFRFVLGGMLPKFVKLHDVAEKQGLVYCLGTNVLNDIDEAAKRRGRFDKQFPIYKPDILSRAGTLLYRLSRVDGVYNYQLKNDGQQIRRFSEVVALTVNQTAEQISKLFFEIPGYLTYILDHKAKTLDKGSIRKNADKKFNQLKNDLETFTDAEPKEKTEHKFIIESEKEFIDVVLHSKSNLTVESLGRYLNAKMQIEEAPAKKNESAATEKPEEE